MTKVDRYIFFEIVKGSLLVFFIFLSISWLLQFTRLLTLTNLIQVDIFTILYLSIFLIPNLITVIMPFVIMFGLIITFVKLHKDRELISLYALGLNIQSITKPLIFFSFFIISILIIFNFYISPKVYKDYKTKEYEIRNKINFEKILVSNFIEINKDTFLDFKNNNQNFKEVFIKFSDNNENMIYANEADIIQEDNKFNFKLINGFKITLLENDKIEKLEFNNYTLEIINNSFQKYDNFDNNTFDIFDDIINKNYINILYKIADSLIVIFIIIFFYINSIKIYNFTIQNLFIYIIFSTILLIINQILKNSSFNISTYIIINIVILFMLFSYFLIRNKNFQN